MKTYSVELVIESIHDIVVTAENYEEARNKVLQDWKDGYISPLDETLWDQKARVISFTTIKNVNQSNFIDDEEKMIDFNTITKEQFLNSYSYITEQEYDNTLKQLEVTQWTR